MMLSAPGFQFSEGFFNWIEVGGIRWQIRIFYAGFVADTLDTLELIFEMEYFTYFIMVNLCIVHYQYRTRARKGIRVRNHMFFEEFDKKVGVKRSMNNHPIDESIVSIKRQ